jgi:formylglycine-generating enzyme required for sulfatase activity
MKRLAAVAQVALCFVFVFCNIGDGQTRPPELAGQWEHASGATRGKPENLELFKDGTGVVDGKGSVTWKVENKRFVILSPLFALSCNYKVSGYELSLAYDDGESAIFVKKGKLEEFKAKVEKAKLEEAKRAIEQLSKQFVPVSGGTFTMGCTAEQGNECESDEKPAHSVTVNDFSIGKVEVTQGLWTAVMGSNPSNFEGDSNLPVESVSWNAVQEFIQKLNTMTGKKYRLPTEAEWEYAARGGKSGKGYKYSGGNNIDEVAWYDGNSSSKTHPVGTKQANELGIYDMTGNVWEWVSDWYGENYYSSSPGSNPTGPASGSHRVLRGGSWPDDAGYCRVSIRSYNNPGIRYSNLGFRLAVSP